jgi:hypothetical protein
MSDQHLTLFRSVLILTILQKKKFVPHRERSPCPLEMLILLTEQEVTGASATVFCSIRNYPLDDKPCFPRSRQKAVLPQSKYRTAYRDNKYTHKDLEVTSVADRFKQLRGFPLKVGR